MQIKSLNGTIDITEADRLKIVNSLIKAGLSEKTIAPVFGVVDPRKVALCSDNGHGCDKYHSVKPAALEQLKREIVNKKIDIRRLDTKILKILGG